MAAYPQAELHWDLTQGRTHSESHLKLAGVCTMACFIVFGWTWVTMEKKLDINACPKLTRPLVVFKAFETLRQLAGEKKADAIYTSLLSVLTMQHPPILGHFKINSGHKYSCLNINPGKNGKTLKSLKENSWIIKNRKWFSYIVCASNLNVLSKQVFQ